jgi:uncharacterized integral membrane protein
MYPDFRGDLPDDLLHSVTAGELLRTRQFATRGGQEYGISADIAASDTPTKIVYSSPRRLTMRARLFFLVVAILLVAGFAAQNWPEFLRTSPLTFGVVQEEAPLGLIMLGALGVVLLVFLLSSALQESRFLMESSRHAKSLQAQRDLAEKAEVSRFTDLRQQLDANLRENRQRESIVATEFEKVVVQNHRELRNQLDQINRTLDARLGELEGRMEARLERLQPRPIVETAPTVDTTARERVNP